MKITPNKLFSNRVAKMLARDLMDMTPCLNASLRGISFKYKQLIKIPKEHVSGDLKGLNKRPYIKNKTLYIFPYGLLQYVNRHLFRTFKYDGLKFKYMLDYNQITYDLILDYLRSNLYNHIKIPDIDKHDLLFGRQTYDIKNIERNNLSKSDFQTFYYFIIQNNKKFYRQRLSIKLPISFYYPYARFKRVYYTKFEGKYTINEVYSILQKRYIFNISKYKIQQLLDSIGNTVIYESYNKNKKFKFYREEQFEELIKILGKHLTINNITNEIDTKYGDTNEAKNMLMLRNEIRTGIETTD